MNLFRWFKEPWFINFLQFLGYVLAVGCGLLAATGGLPNIITFQIGHVLAAIVGCLLVIGGVVGAYAVWRGIWILEQIVLWITGIGYMALLVPTFIYAVTGKASTPTIWLIVALEIACIIDNMKRYRRIDWAYLDPAK